MDIVFYFLIPYVVDYDHWEKLDKHDMISIRKKTWGKSCPSFQTLYKVYSTMWRIINKVVVLECVAHPKKTKPHCIGHNLDLLELMKRNIGEGPGPMVPMSSFRALGPWPTRALPQASGWLLNRLLVACKLLGAIFLKWVMMRNFCMPENSLEFWLWPCPGR